jgi:hypothetical protein
MDQDLKNGGEKASGSTSLALPGRKLATSKIPRMLTPSEIALLQQDLRAALSVIGRDEIDNANALLQGCGFASDDFELTQHPDASASPLAPIAGGVTWVRKSTGASRTYVTGSGSKWLRPLEADLRSGVFGLLDSRISE